LPVGGRTPTEWSSGLYRFDAEAAAEPLVNEPPQGQAARLWLWRNDCRSAFCESYVLE